MSASPETRRIAPSSLIAGSLLLLLGGVAAWQALGFDDESRSFPLFVALFLALTGIGDLLRSLLRPRFSNATGGTLLGVFFAAAIIALWGLAFTVGAGFLIPTFLMQLGLLWLSGLRGSIRIAIMAAVITAAAWLLFVWLLDIPLPLSLLPDALQGF